MSAGIQPWDPVKAAQSPFVLKISSSVQIQPTTPPNRKRQLSETLSLMTPTNPHQFKKLFNTIQACETSERTQRLLFQKASKGIDRLSFEYALEKEKRKLTEKQLEQLKRKDKKTKEAELELEAAEQAQIAHFEANPLSASGVGPSLKDHRFEFVYGPFVKYLSWIE